MPIDYDILITYGGIAKKYDKGEIIFHEGSMSYFFYQIVTGSVKLFSTNTEGKELMQGMFYEGESFGESPLLLGMPYPSTAQANTATVVVRISKERLQNVFKDYPEIINQLLYTFAERIYKKAKAVQVWGCHSPEEKIERFLHNEKGKNKGCEKQYVPYTRQQIADFTGLRVETVIRTLLRMSRQGKVKIIDHKIYF
ncbi:MAG: Crp/Fnr family transcriptional regulator [Niabella sp.]